MNNSSPKVTKSIERNTYLGKGVAVFTSGGDSQGMNAAVRAVVRMGLYLGCKTFFIKEGYQGMVDGGKYIVEADWPLVSGIIHLGGTILGSARCKDFIERAGRLKACKNLVSHGITNLVVIGGDGSLTGADLFKSEWGTLLDELVSNGEITDDQRQKHKALHIAGMVATIDNDFCGTDMTIGTDSALHRIIEAIDAISSTAYSHQRTFVMEVMGRHCGYLALGAAMASEASYVFIPEAPESQNWEKRLCSKLQQERAAGQRLNIVIVSEGAIDDNGNAITSEQVKKVVCDELHHDTRITVLGHVQRGGNPSGFDRILACRMGAEAVIALMEANDNTEPCVVTLLGNEVVRLPLMDCVKKTKEIGEAMAAKDFQKVSELRGISFTRSLKIFNTLMQIQITSTNTSDQTYKLAVMHCGSPACGANAAVWSIVRSCIYAGNIIYGIHDGFEGFTSDKIYKMEWNDVTGWLNRGGVMMGTKRTLPTACKIPVVAQKIQEFGIQGLIIIGGFEGFEAANLLADNRDKYPAFNIPIVVLPSTISNNVPGTAFSIGCDTAVNAICEITDRIRQSGQSIKRRVFVIEVMGGYCGYLATVSGLAGGADAAYIYEEEFTIEDLQQDVQHIVKKMSEGMQRGIVLRNENASKNYSTQFVHSLYSEEGRGAFSCRINVLGHTQQGGSPSPFDRSMGIKMGSKAIAWIMDSIKNNTHDSVLLGICGRRYVFTPVKELKKHVNFEKRIPKDDIWWLELRPLLKIMGHCSRTLKFSHSYQPITNILEGDES